MIPARFRVVSRLVCISSCLALAAACSSTPKDDGHEGESAAPNPKALTRTQAVTRAKQVQNVSYHLWFNLAGSPAAVSDSGENAAGEGGFLGRTRISFDLKKEAKSAADELLIDFAGGALSTMTVNGDAVSPAEIADRYDGLRIRVPNSELVDGANRIEIAFTHPFGNNGRGLHRFTDPVDGKVYIYSDLEPYDAHSIFPCFDQPDLKASYELTVEVPADWEVIANMPEREVTKVDGRRSWQFPPSPIFSTYVFAMHAGHYKSWKSDARGVPIRLFARQSLARYVDAAEWFEVTKNGLDFFGAEFGLAYPYPKYDQLIVPDFNAGAMENVGAVTFSERYVFRSKVTEDRKRARADTILHEMAHMWFGDLVTMRWWNGLWLNESFATFMAAGATDRATRFRNVWQSFFAGMKQWAYWEDQLVTTHPIEVPVRDADQAFANFDGITYGKGASVLKQLYFYLGADDFREGVRRYFKEFAAKNTTLADFMRMLGESSGQSLADWEKAWLQTPGLNTLQAAWRCDADNRQISEFTLVQGPSEFNPALRPHKTKVALYGHRGPQATPGLRLASVIDIAYSGQETVVEEAIGKPCPVAVYPNHLDYDFVKVILDPRTLKAVENRLSRVDDSFTRQMLWHNLWEMVRDGKLKAQAYAEIAFTHLAGETDSQVVSRVLGTLYTPSLESMSVAKVLPPASRNAFLARVANFAYKQMKEAPRGGDLQLVWFQNYVRTARSPNAQELMTGFLDGSKGVGGIRMEQERRWEAVHALARMGHPAAESLIERELKLDNTDMGKKEAISAEAALPSDATKRKWLANILQTSGGEKPKLSEIKAAMRSFHQVGQEELSAGVVDEFFERLPTLAASVDEEYYSSLSEDFFPALCEASIVERVGASLKSAKLPAAVVKNLKIARQEADRCVKARTLAATPATAAKP